MLRRNTGEFPRLSREGEQLSWIPGDPFRQMSPFWPAEEQPVRFAPDFEVKETKEGFEFKADLPGVKEKDLEITMTGNRLTISGKREADMEEKADTYYACERSYGSFTRSFTLPEGTDGENHSRAELKEGVLTLLLPKKLEQQPRRIEVKVTDKPQS
jgi:HSP20 family protein